MIWYWYLTGAATVITCLSMLANVGFASGWLRYERVRNGRQSALKIYDQDLDDSYMD